MVGYAESREKGVLLLCSQVMPEPVHMLTETDTVEAAARRMHDADIGFLPVCNALGAVIGSLTDRDIVLRIVARGLSPTVPVSDVMTREVVACKPTDEFFVAQQLMRERRVSHVVCVDDARRPVGVISLSEVVRHEDGFRLAKTVRGALEHHGERTDGPPSRRLSGTWRK